MVKSKGKRDRNGAPVRFLLSFEHFCDLMLEEDKWKNYGVASNQYCIARNNDLGDYTDGNVSIITMEENNRIRYERMQRNTNGSFKSASKTL